MSEYISNLAPLLIDFVEFKNSLGIKYKSAVYYLHKLDIYNYEHKNVSIPDRETVDGWAIKWAEHSESQDRSWISPIREFGRYLQCRGYKNAYVIDNRFSIQKYHAEVYLMTEAEIRTFFEECDKYVLRYKAKGRAYVFPALYRLMYCCGVRSAEARNLKCCDVHLKEKYIDILQSKAHRDRRLFISNELTEYLKKYDSAIEKCFPNREYFSPGGYGGICSSSALSANFRNIWISAGLKRDGKVKPRAYDFRHHFACANIMRWSQEGKDIHAMLPYLMRYMGHTGIESTYYYIHLIPDYFPQYSMLTVSTETLIPEVETDEI
jgi:integrase